MLGVVQRFIKSKKGYLLQVFMALLIIGGMGYYLLNEKYKNPMESQMDTLNTNITKWISPASGDD